MVVRRARIFLAVNVLMFIEIYCDTNEIEPRVVGGQLVPITKFPHVVFLKGMLYGGGENMCGASILNQYLLVTAAHCLDDVNLRRGKIWAFVGHENINEINIVRSVKKMYIHEDYDPVRHTPGNDIAILLLKRALPFNSNIQRITINIRHPEVSEGYLASWGVIDEENELQTFWLHSVSQKLQPSRLCNQLLSSRLTGTFCAGSKDKKQPRPSLGDSGSGLITIHRELFGVMSMKPVNFPAIAFYTNVTYFYSWVIEKASEALKSTCRRSNDQNE